MPRRVDAGCLLCFPDPCECNGGKPKKEAKKTVPRKKSVTPKPVGSVETSTAESTAEAPAGPVVDVRAAMKAAVSGTAYTDTEMLDALAALEPLLHADEMKQIKPELDRYKPAAQRWKERNASST